MFAKTSKCGDERATGLALPNVEISHSESPSPLNPSA